ncbi:DUF4198 domain-containing protein [Pseudorhodoferax soli]|uniref:Uncharacterized protein DUF4198 n=1 Tax=Pseudorhodoferax soli TaxID=545864 RepID=A0A368XM57_9BURK|nr:DUF4198 domain-containing protein [Pseudorhodoferax soli]RCW68629.1 uncharacterized protein DUF4198 [Pseudorhodoferax soli]
MPIHRPCATLALAIAIALPVTGHAHRSFLLPSATVVTPDQKTHWITVDAARSNELFSFNHNAMATEGLQIVSPDGSSSSPTKLERFRYRTVFDWQLTQEGTWQAAVVERGLRAEWVEDGKPKRWSGPAQDYERSVPRQAEKLSVSEVSSRVETFVTFGAPTAQRLTGSGLEALYGPHPNALTAGRTSALRFQLDGKPAAGVKVQVLQGGAQHQTRAAPLELQTDSEGRVLVQWKAPGMYWISATLRQGSATAPASQGTASYVATVEVRPESTAVAAQRRAD